MEQNGRQLSHIFRNECNQELTGDTTESNLPAVTASSGDAQYALTVVSIHGAAKTAQHVLKCHFCVFIIIQAVALLQQRR